MDDNTYNLIVGIVLVLTSLIFFALPAFLPYDPMIPVLLAIVSLVGAISFFYRGLVKKDNT
jgi:hypothetical protein